VQTLTVELDDRSYPILIGEGLLQDSAALGRHIPGRDLLLVSNTTVAPLYAGALAQHLPDRRIVQAVLPDGELHKNLATVSRLLDVLVANRFGRDVTIVALGGGVVGDMAGFAAASYQRGVAYVQVPTTLLAQVDSSVGGKTGVNHPGGKNLIGAFHQPVAVIADTATLATLSDRELRAGLAEIIKYGLIRDAAFFDWLEESMDRLLAREPGALARAIRRSCEIKAEIVGRDEREHGERALLNFGHTFGHAIESATGYSGWLHGEAVGAGLAMAAAMSRARGTLDAEQVERVRAILERTGLPTAARDVRAASALDHMRIDKKVKAGRVRLVLLRGIGDAYVTGDYADDDLKATVAAHCG
jgi:3-dehydroquinate synthase